MQENCAMADAFMSIFGFKRQIEDANAELAKRKEENPVPDMYKKIAKYTVDAIYEHVTDKPINAKPIAEKMGIAKQTVSRGFRILEAEGRIEMIEQKHRRCPKFYVRVC